MKLTSAGANKNDQSMERRPQRAEKEEAESRTTYGINEEPLPTKLRLLGSQQQMDALNQKIAVLRHAVNVFNTTTMLEDLGLPSLRALVL